MERRKPLQRRRRPRQRQNRAFRDHCENIRKAKTYFMKFFSQTNHPTEFTLKSIGKVIQRPCETPAATTAPECTIGPSYTKTSFKKLSVLQFSTPSDFSDSQSACNATSDSYNFCNQSFQTNNAGNLNAV